jgi:Glycosyl transferases group 1/Glycosyl transferase 4-like domain
VRILVLSFYYYPDLSAGSFRATALVRALRKEMSTTAQIEVVTTLPNRYRSYVAQSSSLEAEPGVDVHRISIPEHASDMIGQSKAFIRFALEAMRYTRGRRYDLVFATSSRLMTAALGALIARRCNAKLYLDIRDIFVDTIKDVLPRPAALIVRPVSELLEKWTIRSAAHVNLVSAGFTEYFSSRYPNIEYSVFTNGIDDEFLAVDEFIENPRSPGPLRITYAGNIGEGQGLHEILPQLALRMRDRARFKVIGDGGRREELLLRLEAVNARGLVEVVPPVSRDKLITEYLDADVLFLHLNDYPAFKKVLPSKLFEYAALGKPIWAGVGGYAAHFVGSQINNAAVFRPCDAQDAVRAFDKLAMGGSLRRDFRAKYARGTIMSAMANQVRTIAEG